MQIDEHLRSPRHPRRAIGRISCGVSTSCCKATTVSTRAIFASLGLQAAPARGTSRTRPLRTGRSAAASDEMLRAVAAGMAIVSAYRRYGHLAANLDPLGDEPVGDPRWSRQTYGLTPALAERDPRVRAARQSSRQYARRRAAAVFDETYSSTIAYEIEHISNRDAARVAARLHRVGPEQGQPLAAAADRVARTPDAASKPSTATCAKRFSGRRRSRAKVST